MRTSEKRITKPSRYVRLVRGTGDIDRVTSKYQQRIRASKT